MGVGALGRSPDAMSFSDWYNRTPRAHSLAHCACYLRRSYVKKKNFTIISAFCYDRRLYALHREAQ
jgi:hypothetical protein